MGQIIKSDISKEMKYRYPIYALDVITDRALADVRDGLKPVHRRILYAMQELGLLPEKGYRKCARIVGDVLGKYHPHGDTSVYGALVRLAQDFSMRYVLVDGHGNFGSVDGDSAAAMRYTEAKMKDMLLEMLRDINKNVVDFKPNFDGEEQEPVVLPSRFPNLLVNGSSGIAVGMSSNIPPHNLGEVIDGTIALIENNEITIEELVKYIQAPDFPTSATIINSKDMVTMYKSGKGKITLRSKYHIENEDDKKQIVFTEIPYQINKQRLCTDIVDLIRDKKEGFKNILEVRDESDKEGMRIVIELKKNENEDIILALLLSKTNLQKDFSAEFRALVDGEPKLLNLKEILHHYIQFQKEVVTRRSQFDLDKSTIRLHILEGFKIALDNMDNVISIIRNSKTVETAKNTLMSKLNLSEKQSQVILEMRLRRLTGLEREKIDDEYNELLKQIEYLKSILADENRLNEVLKEELLEIKEKYNDNRKTEILQADEVKTIEVKKEDLIEDFTTTLVFTKEQYFKKTRKYSEVQKVKDGDEVQTMIQCSNKDKAIFISNQGNAYFLNLWEVNEKTPSTMGDYLLNLLPLEKNECIIGMLTTNQYKGEEVVVYPDGHIAIIPLESYYTKQNSTRLKNCLAKKLGMPVLITQITEDVDIELIDCFGKTKIITTKGINRKDTKNAQGITAWKSSKKDWCVVSASIIKE